jgi:hypothetical protein
VEPALFLERFGVGVDEAQTLIEAKTLNISKLMTIMPTGTVDPRYSRSGLLLLYIYVIHEPRKLIYRKGKHTFIKILWELK